MGYPYDSVGADEEVLVHSHPHWKMLVPPILWTLFATAVVFFGAAIAWRTIEADSTRNIAVGALVVVWLVVAAGLLVRPVVKWATTHFVVTTSRVMTREGWLARSGIVIPLVRINSVQFQHGVLDRILRTGTLVIESASDDPLEFDDIPQVERVHALLYREVNDESERSGGRRYDQYHDDRHDYRRR